MSFYKMRCRNTVRNKNGKYFTDKQMKALELGWKLRDAKMMLNVAFRMGLEDIVIRAQIVAKNPELTPYLFTDTE